MLLVIDNARIHAPENLGGGQVIVGGGRILHAGSETMQIDDRLISDRLDAQGAALIPGLVDAHVHLTGGGGEDGFSTQAPAVPLSDFTRHGVTSVVGLLGTDDETRSTANLVARTRALREEGLSAWCWTGGYHLPPTTLTGSVRKDIVSVDCIIGLGELALSDHRSSQPTDEELARVASEVHVAGLLTRKAGVLHLHLGDGERGLAPLRRLLAETELPPRVFHPTHVNRRPALFEEACALAQDGVTIDLTAFPPANEGDEALSAAEGWERYIHAGGHVDRITVSSDGGGCLPVFDDEGRMQRMDFATPATLAGTIVELLRRGHALSDVLPAFTSNVARLLRLPRKGRIETGADADLVIVDEAGLPRSVMARGRWMVRDGVALAKGTFEV